MKNSVSFNKKFFTQFANLIANHDSCKTDNFFEQVFNIISNIVNYDYLSIYLYNSSAQKIELVAKRGAEVDLIKLIKFEYGRGLSAWVAKDKKTIHLNNINNKTLDGTILQAFCSFPLLHENELIGVMNLGSNKPNSFSENVIETLEVFSPLLASIILKNNLISQIKDQKKKIQEINTELNNTKDQLIKLEQKEAVSAAIVSLNHEINNPLMIIQGNLQLLKLENKDSKDNEKFETIETQLERVTNLMKKLRELKEIKLTNYVEGSNQKMLEI